MAPFAIDSLRRLLGLAPKASNLPALDENNRLCRDLDQNRPLTDYVYTVLDTELTGLSARKEEIVSIGAVRLRGLAIVPGESFSALVRPSIPLPKVSTLIHRITPEAIVEAPPLREVLPGLIEFCKGTLIVGHHIGLDMSFLNRACRKHTACPWPTPVWTPCAWPCSGAEAQPVPLRTLQPEHLLRPDDLAEEFELPRFTAHDALGDALQTAYLFVYLAKKSPETPPSPCRSCSGPARAGAGTCSFILGKHRNGQGRRTPDMLRPPALAASNGLSAAADPENQNREKSILVPTTNRIHAKTRFSLSTGRLWARRTPRGAVSTLMTAMDTRAGSDTYPRE
jgi:DNA polymerase-3 subunit epsilon